MSVLFLYMHLKSFQPFLLTFGDDILENVARLSDISGIWRHFSCCLWGRVKIRGLHVTQDLIFIVRKAAEEKSQAYFHNGGGPGKAVGPAEHIDSRHWNISWELHWVNDQAHDGEHGWRNGREQNVFKLTPMTSPASIIPVAKPIRVLEDLKNNPLLWQTLYYYP